MTNQDNKSHDSILVPLLGRGVFTAGFAPVMPFPTHTYKCVRGSRSRKSRLVAPRRLASSSSLCLEVMNFSAPTPCNTPLCHGAPSSILHGIEPGSPMVVTLGLQYNVGEKPTVILYTYIYHHAEPPNIIILYIVKRIVLKYDN